MINQAAYGAALQISKAAMQETDHNATGVFVTVEHSDSGFVYAVWHDAGVMREAVPLLCSSTTLAQLVAHIKEFANGLA